MDILRPVEAERGVILGCLSGRAEHARAADKLSSEDFSDEVLRRIFTAFKGLQARHETVGLVEVDAELTRLYGQDRAAQAMQAAMDILKDGTLTAWQTPRFVSIVQDASQRRRLVSIGEKLSLNASNPQCEVATVLDDARTELQKSTNHSGAWVNVSDVVLAAYEAAEDKQKPMSTGIHELDMILCGGLHRGELTIIGARPAVGKSALLLSIALNAARDNCNVAFVSLEMSELQIGARILSAKSGVNAALLRSGDDLPKDLWTDLADALLDVEENGVERISFMVDGMLTVEKLRQEIQSMAERNAVDLVVVDYLQLMRTTRKTSSELERLETVSRGLKAITLDLNVPVVAAAQLRRQNNIGGVLRAPTLDELRGSGSMEQDADNVILIHRIESTEDSLLKTKAYDRVAGAYERAQAAGQNLLSLDVCKQRQGRAARAWVLFDGAHMRFFDPSEV